MSSPAAETKNNGSAIEPAKNPTVVVGQMVTKLVESNKLHLPADYSAENALKSAWLKLQEVIDKDKKPALSVCSQPSIVNALLDMVVQGLNPMKNQCYFIVYGKQLSMQRSYFGDMLIAQRVRPGIEFYHGVIYEGDSFAYEVKRGRQYVTKHEQKLDNIANSRMKGVYVGIVDSTGEDLGIELMTMEQIHQSWQKSKTYQFDNSTHKLFPVEMSLRTAYRKRCKSIINSSNDQLLLESIQRADLDSTEAEVDEDAMMHANGPIIDAEAVETPALTEDTQATSQEGQESPAAARPDPYQA